jgi:GxxExxY protein
VKNFREKMAQKDLIFQVCDEVRDCSHAPHKCVRHGHKEKTDENGLANLLHRKGIEFAQQPFLSVFDNDGVLLGDLALILLGDLALNMLVFSELVIEPKAVKTILNEPIAQLLRYGRASSKVHGLLINFGSPVLQIRKYTLSKDLDSES